MKDIEKKKYIGYKDIIDSFEYKVVLEFSDAAYEGDSNFILKDGQRLGWLCFGWGSCSECDALEACNNDVEEITSLRNGLHDSIKWFDDAAEALEFFNNHDWEGDYSHREEFVRLGKLAIQKEMIMNLAGIDD